MMGKNGDGNCETGYGKPPRHTRFQKGHSGNPKGRPRGAKNSATILTEALHEPVIISENGRRKKVTKQQAIIKQIVNKAASGDHRSIQLLLANLIPAIEARLESAPSSGNGGPLTMVNFLKLLGPLPDGLSRGTRRAYGELEEPTPAIERMASANPEPIPSTRATEQHHPSKTDRLTDRDLAAIYAANKKNGKPSS